MFSTWSPVLLSPKLCRLHWPLLGNSSLLAMKVKDKKSEIFSQIREVEGEFLAGSHTTFLNKELFKHIFALLLMQMCACLKEHMREIIDYMFCTLCKVCPGSTVSWYYQDCNRQNMPRVQNTWSIGTGPRLNARTQM